MTTPLLQGEYSHSPERAKVVVQEPRREPASSIRLIGLHAEFDARYEGLITDFINSEWPRKNDKKSKLKAIRLLRQPISRHILSIIWKESEFVTEFELKSEGLCKYFEENCLNVYRLAVYTSMTVDDVCPNTAFLRRMVNVAHELNLVTKGPQKGTSVPIYGTKTLNDLMRQLSKIYKKEALSTMGALDD